MPRPADSHSARGSKTRSSFITLDTTRKSAIFHRDSPAHAGDEGPSRAQTARRIDYGFGDLRYWLTNALGGRVIVVMVTNDQSRSHRRASPVRRVGGFRSSALAISMSFPQYKLASAYCDGRKDAKGAVIGVG